MVLPVHEALLAHFLSDVGIYKSSDWPSGCDQMYSAQWIDCLLAAAMLLWSAQLLLDLQIRICPMQHHHRVSAVCSILPTAPLFLKCTET